MEKSLQNLLSELQAKSLASSSALKYAATWKQWVKWCKFMHFPPWLSKNREQHSYQLALFAVYCWRFGFSDTRRGNSAATILSKICHIWWYHQCHLGFNVGLLAGHKLAVTGMRRSDPTSAKKRPITIPILRRLHRELNFEVTHDRVLWGAAVMGFFYLLRRSEYLAQGNNFQNHVILRSDVQILNSFGRSSSTLHAATHAVINFRSSKADQFGVGAQRTLTRSGLTWCCPVQALWYLIKHHESVNAPTNSPLCQISRGKYLQVNDLVAAIKAAAAEAGENPQQFGSHSLRSGGATALFNSGVDSLAVKKFGRWKSDAFERYAVIQADLSSKLAAKMISSRD